MSSADVSTPEPRSALKHGLIAYIAPFAIYILLTSVESKGWLRLGHEYEILCSLKGLLVAVALWMFRHEYPSFSRQGMGLGLILGVVGLPLWLGLDRLQTAMTPLHELIESVMGTRVGYDPFKADGARAWQYGFIAMRLIELAVVVPVMEEIFWRGFLARYFLAEDFRTAPYGKFTTFSFWVVTLAFTSVHPEILAALAWGMLINFLYRRTSNLWACVAMHAATNALLGGYILATENWKLW